MPCHDAFPRSGPMENGQSLIDHKPQQPISKFTVMIEALWVARRFVPAIPYSLVSPSGILENSASDRVKQWAKTREALIEYWGGFSLRRRFAYALHEAGCCCSHHRFTGVTPALCNKVRGLS